MEGDTITTWYIGICPLCCILQYHLLMSLCQKYRERKGLQRAFLVDFKFPCILEEYLVFRLTKKCLHTRFALQYWIVTKAPKVAKESCGGGGGRSREKSGLREGANRSSLTPSSLSPQKGDCHSSRVPPCLPCPPKRGWIAITMSLGG